MAAFLLAALTTASGLWIYKSKNKSRPVGSLFKPYILFS